MSAVEAELGAALDMGAKARVKKLWTFCQAAKAEPVSGSGPPSSAPQARDDEENLPEGVPEAIEMAWIKKHQFHLSGSRLLIGGDYNRIYNCINKRNPARSRKWIWRSFG